MAQKGIKSTIELVDKMTPTLRRVTDGVSSLISRLSGVERSQRNAFRADTARGMAGAIDRADNSANKLAGTLARVGGMIGTYFGVQKIIGLSDTLASTKARLDMMNDGLQSTADLQNLIYQSAQRSRGAYQDTADMVAKLGIMAGDAFSGTREVVAFAEQVNKQFTIAGASADEMKNATLQLTQALASGVLRGDELNSIFEQAPTIIMTIADYLGVATGEIREMAADGLISAEIVKNALLSAADETNAKFEQMPMTFEQIWTQIKNSALMAFQPILEKINEVFNSEQFTQFTDMLIGAIVMIAEAALWAFQLILDVASLIQDNWGTIAPIFYGVAGAVIAYQVATLAAQAAQWLFNTALFGCPVVWLLVALVAIIAAIFALVDAYNQATGESVSALGIIFGAIAVAGAAIYNVFVGLWNLVAEVAAAIWNAVAAVANFIGNVFSDPIGAVMRMFADLADAVLSLLGGIAGALDAVFGSNLKGAVDGWRTSLSAAVTEKYGAGTEVMPKFDSSLVSLERIDYGDAWDFGYKGGAGLQSGAFDPASLLSGFAADVGAFSPHAMDGFGDFSDIYDGAGGTDPSKLLGEGKAGKKKNKALGNIDKNTDKIKKSVDRTKEEMKHMTDLAEQRAINRFTLLGLKLEVNNDNSFASNMDIDGAIRRFVDGITDSVQSAAEGVHY